jgi:diamine N-acetyltransferase
MVRKYDEKGYFLWDFAIDYKYQNQKLGTEALTNFMDYMIKNYNLLEMTTTYIWGNDHAKHLYEKVGFIETDIIDEPRCHEVNMIYRHI